MKSNNHISVKDIQKKNEVVEPQRHRITRDAIERLYAALVKDEANQVKAMMTELSISQPIIHKGLEKWKEHSEECSLIRSTTLAALTACKAFAEAFPNLPQVSCCELEYAVEDVNSGQFTMVPHQLAAIVALYNIVLDAEPKGERFDNLIHSDFSQSVVAIVLALDSAAARSLNESDPDKWQELKRRELKCAMKHIAKHVSANCLLNY